ncbi:FecR family protein [Pedobacter sandarakinus]|uniref:FecR family protein n=1 Tax=Pedobacter sandarakinus TaxID=353156 RepID=UPI002245162C|nr:FecR domain-containing protein [Pedobacter sandarakinus]MCX2573153.1 DUF4974 domain-containing protein [Pedobacter sandarakinus]
MVDRSKFNAEDFLVDSTFQQYCAGTDQLCIGYWEKYISAHPEQAEVIKEAKRLFIILSGNKRQLNTQVEHFRDTFGESKVVKLNRFLWLKIAAVFIILVGAGLVYLKINNPKQPGTLETSTVFVTKSGERKKIELCDGTSVLLNAKSSITIGKGFNDEKREVVLVGEAFFDVAHDQSKPFMVHTADFNINVLGTAFNVKAYPDEITSEATLIRGSITMEAVNGSGGTITLKPSQKVTFYKNLPTQPTTKLSKPVVAHPEVVINHYTLIKDTTIVETAWTQNHIEIYDQDFDQVKAVLEKWYNVEIKFAHPEIEKYRFTATFSNETLEQALSALQKAENFKYEIKGKTVIISK